MPELWVEKRRKLSNYRYILSRSTKLFLLWWGTRVKFLCFCILSCGKFRLNVCGLWLWVSKLFKAYPLSALSILQACFMSCSLEVLRDDVPLCHASCTYFPASNFQFIRNLYWFVSCEPSLRNIYFRKDVYISNISCICSTWWNDKVSYE